MVLSNFLSRCIVHPCLQASKPISLLEALDTTHSSLRQVWLVFQWGWDELGEEQQRLKDWGSMLKAWTNSAQQKAVEKSAYMDKVEEVLKEEQVAISRLDQKTQELLQQAKEAHATADTCISACVKL
jgi:hypothetical protein